MVKEGSILILVCRFCDDVEKVEFDEYSNKDALLDKLAAWNEVHGSVRN